MERGKLIRLQIFATKASLWALSYFVNLESMTYDDKLVNGLDFVANSVLQIPFLLMTLMRYISPILDDMSVSGLQFGRVTLAKFKQVHGIFTLG